MNALAKLFAALFGITILAGIFVMGLILFADSGSGAARPLGIPDRSDACFMSQKFVKQNLKAPATAEFPAWTEANCKATQTGNNWKVRSYVDAQNGFGAMIRSDYGVEMNYKPSTDSWVLLDIMIVSP